MIEILKTDSVGSVERRVILSLDDVNLLLFSLDSLVMLGLKPDDCFALRRKLFSIF